MLLSCTVCIQLASAQYLRTDGTNSMTNHLNIDMPVSYSSIELKSNIGSFIDFHSSMTSDFDGRIIWNLNNSGEFKIYGRTRFDDDVLASGKLELQGTNGLRMTASNSDPNDFMIIKPNINVSTLNPGPTIVAAQITNRHFGHLVVDIGANDSHDSFAIRTDSDYNGEVDNIAMTVKPSGNVLIGKTSQSNTSFKLDIAGKVRANEIVVNTDGADYVFEESYKLKSLREVEAFINENNHLPGIPSATEMQAQGMSVGELNTKLKEKIEELTLHPINQQKEIEELKSEQASYADLESRLEELTLSMVELKKENQELNRRIKTIENE